MIKDFLMLIGAFVIALGILGAFDAGHFRLYFGDDPHGCTAMENRMEQSK